MVSGEERVAHLQACRPEIATLDCGTMNFAEADYVMTNTPWECCETWRSA
jgi:uncharacterized protein (DUF849 family)